MRARARTLDHLRPRRAGARLLTLYARFCARLQKRDGHLGLPLLLVYDHINIIKGLCRRKTMRLPNHAAYKHSEFSNVSTLIQLCVYIHN